MHLRRALLLLALVLALGAVVAALSSPTERARDGEPAAPLREPRPAPGGASEQVEVRVDARRAATRHEVPLGVPVTVTVAVDAPGEVAIPDLGLIEFAEPRAPARFDLLFDEPAEHALRFDPLGEREPRTIGRLVATR